MGQIAYTATKYDESIVIFINAEEPFNEDDWDYDIMERSPEYDRFASLGYVPTKQLHDDGWTLECNECNKKIDSDLWDYDEDIELSPVFIENRAFCSLDCCKVNNDRKQERANAIDDIKSKYPGTFNLFAYHSGDGSIQVHFRFPSGKNAVVWESSNPNYLQISKEDLKTWQEYLLTLNKNHKN